MKDVSARKENVWHQNLTCQGLPLTRKKTKIDKQDCLATKAGSPNMRPGVCLAVIASCANPGDCKLHSFLERPWDHDDPADPSDPAMGSHNPSDPALGSRILPFGSC